MSLQKELFQYIKDSNLNKVKQIITKNPFLINSMMPDETVLSINSWIGEQFDDVIADMPENESRKVEYKRIMEIYRDTPLVFSIKNKEFDIFKFLLKVEADVNLNNALIASMSVYNIKNDLRDYSYFDELVKHPNIDKNNFEAMLQSIANYDIYYFPKFIQNDFNINLTDIDGINLLGYARTSELIKFLLNAGLLPTDKEIMKIILNTESPVKIGEKLDLLMPKFLENYANTEKIFKFYRINNTNKYVVNDTLLQKFLESRIFNVEDKELVKGQLMQDLDEYVYKFVPSLKNLTIGKILKNINNYNVSDLKKFGNDILGSLSGVYETNNIPAKLKEAMGSVGGTLYYQNVKYKPKLY